MKVDVVEWHRNSARDAEGYEYDRRTMELDSAEFLKYMDDFHVMGKYLENKICNSGELLNHDGKVIAKREYYFNNWVMIDGEKPHKEMCYIIVEYPV